MTETRTGLPGGVFAYRRRLLLAVVAASLALVAVVASAATRGDADSAVDRVLEAAARGDQHVVVARVGDREIRRGSVTGYLAIGAIPAATTSDGTPASSLDADAALQLLIDAKLLALAAEGAGITVADEDVTTMIVLGLAGPLRTGAMPEEQARLVRAYLKLAGTDEDHVENDPAARESFRDMLLGGRYVQQSGRPRADLLAEARQQIPVEIVPGALNP